MKYKKNRLKLITKDTTYIFFMSIYPKSINKMVKIHIYYSFIMMSGNYDE